MLHTKMVRSDQSSLGGLEPSQCWTDSWNQGAKPRCSRREKLALPVGPRLGPELESWVLAHTPSFCAMKNASKLSPGLGSEHFGSGETPTYRQMISVGIQKSLELFLQLSKEM